MHTCLCVCTHTQTRLQKLHPTSTKDMFQDPLGYLKPQMAPKPAKPMLLPVHIPSKTPTFSLGEHVMTSLWHTQTACILTLTPHSP